MAALLLYPVLLLLVVSNDVTVHDAFSPIQTMCNNCAIACLKRFKSPGLANSLLRLPSTGIVAAPLCEYGNTYYVRCLLLPHIPKSVSLGLQCVRVSCKSGYTITGCREIRSSDYR